MSLVFRKIAANLSHPEHGWKTTHFWGPAVNWGLVGAAVYDTSLKGPETIDISLTATMIGYSAICTRFAWMLTPRNYFLFSCHAFNLVAQFNQLRRAVEYSPPTKDEIMSYTSKGAILGASLLAILTGSSRVQSTLSQPTVNEYVRKMASHPAGPFTVHFWAPVAKAMLSVNNIVDYKKPTEKISIPQQSALAATGFIWARFATVLVPMNPTLFAVNIVLGVSSSYHLLRKIKADYL